MSDHGVDVWKTTDDDAALDSEGILDERDFSMLLGEARFGFRSIRFKAAVSEKEHGPWIPSINRGGGGTRKPTGAYEVRSKYTCAGDARVSPVRDTTCHWHSASPHPDICPGIKVIRFRVG